MSPFTEAEDNMFSIPKQVIPINVFCDDNKVVYNNINMIIIVYIQYEIKI